MSYIGTMSRTQWAVPAAKVHGHDVGQGYLHVTRLLQGSTVDIMSVLVSEKIAQEKKTK